MYLYRAQTVNISNSIIYHNNGNIVLGSTNPSNLTVSYSDIENSSNLIGKVTGCFVAADLYIAQVNST